MTTWPIGVEPVIDENRRLALEFAMRQFKLIDTPTDEERVGTQILALAERYRKFLEGTRVT